MYRKCNIHVLEIDVAISKLFYKLNENSTSGEQIKYYRRLANIKQTDLCLKLGCDRGVLDLLSK